VPRRYRGKDFAWWQNAMGAFSTPVERRPPDQASLVHSGAYGGRTIDFRRFASQGIVLLGRAEGAQAGVVTFAPNLAESLALGDASFLRFLDTVDELVRREGLDFPEEPAARIMPPDPPGLGEPIRRLNLQSAGIGTVIWATGYGYDLDWVHLPVTDARGEPRHHLGITDVPGLYFLGLHWLSTASSAFLPGVGDDAARLADHIVARG
jgi:putative flavoprotein involved in K+ transport